MVLIFCHQLSVQRSVHSGSVLGDPYGCGKCFVGIKFTVLFQYRPLVLKCNFKIAVNKNHSMTIRVTLYQQNVNQTALKFQQKYIILQEEEEENENKSAAEQADHSESEDSSRKSSTGKDFEMVEAS